MKSKTSLRLLKAIIFISSVVGYGYLVGVKAEILFALILAMYILELYKSGGNK